MPDPNDSISALTLWVRTTPHVHAAWLDPTTHPATLVALIEPRSLNFAEHLPHHFLNHPIHYIEQEPFAILHCGQNFPAPHARTACHNEPVPGGVQIQPQGANWVGTLGCACSYHNAAGNKRWGILSNWHVLKMDVTTPNCPIHQPLATFPAIAHNDRHREVSPDQPNTFDAALADAKIDGLHTVGPDLYEIGPLAPTPSPPQVGLAVSKSGRTSAVTEGRIDACGVTVQVSYGSFTATFTDQCIIAGTAGAFSAPGDSGSLVVTTAGRHPVALLFAGNDTLTVASPLAPIVEAFALDFSFPQPPEVFAP